MLSYCLNVAAKQSDSGSGDFCDIDPCQIGGSPVNFLICVEEVLRKRNTDPNSYAVPDVSSGYIMALLYGSLKDARNEWNRHQPRGGETKFTRRQNIVSKMIRISAAKLDAEGVNVWTWLQDVLLGALDAGGMSSEEDEIADITHRDGTIESTTVHAITVCPWRAQKVTQHLLLIDKMAPVTMLAPPHGRTRVRTQTESERFPPLGLPRAMYNTAWLAAQKAFMPTIKLELEISEKDFTMMEIEEVEH
ncbi:hypothetical protein B0H16DRAFT_1455000 [Mycena metata]|uniref:Uncharacterized protein n=1 Tax=Mycena metata TaxID=1033252 RepID=A0AAD7JIZ4_9AGAR|nr:hypothetical protein B0H16DRAFT_1455000 [Mycena metata]